MLTENLSRQATERGDAVALVDGAQRHSYADLHGAAAAVAAQLGAKGVRVGDRVALLLDNGFDYVAALYGCLACGAVAVPLNTAARAGDLGGWIAHADARAVVLAPGHPAAGELLATARGDGRLILMTSGADVVEGSRLCTDARTAYGALARPASADAPAMILYTSGTTGRPKGVVLTHRNLAANVAAIVDYLALGPTDRMVTVLPFFYSFGNSVLHTHLAVGAMLVLEPNLVYPQKVLETLVRERATGFAGVPSTFALLLSRARLADYDLSALRYVQQAGGGMPPALIERTLQALPASCSFFVMYGQTEATARISYLPPEHLRAKPGSVGIPLRGVEIEVRREDRSRCAALEVGTIFVRGEGVMAGYWNDPGLTASVLAGGWLNTGDSGYVDADGYLYIAGRRSDIIKTGAHRVQPQDVEAVIAEIEGVEEAAVVPVDDDILGEVVKAVVVLRPGAVVTDLEIKARCRARLAAYKIPKRVEFASSLPRTSTGKVQRHLLARP
ncbi:MAG: acyl--CoA ligase [Gammaproteobacteria bacterium]|nr:acyl--CoA ligase [Gammaproteobacteria bacterium]